MKTTIIYLSLPLIVSISLPIFYFYTSDVDKIQYYEEPVKNLSEDARVSQTDPILVGALISPEKNDQSEELPITGNDVGSPLSLEKGIFEENGNKLPSFATSNDTIKKFKELKVGDSFEFRDPEENLFLLPVNSVQQSFDGYRQIKGQRIIDSETHEFFLSINIFGDGHGFIEMPEKVYEVTVHDNNISYHELPCVVERCTDS